MTELDTDTSLEDDFLSQRCSIVEESTPQLGGGRINSYLHSYRVLKDEVYETTIPLFYSTEKREELLESVVASFIRNLSNGVTFVSDVPYAYSVDRYVAKMQDYGDAEVLGFTMFLRSYSKHYATNLRFSKRHLEGLKELDDYDASRYYWYPELTQSGPEGLQLLMQLPSRMYRPQFVDKCRDIEYLRFAVKSYLILDSVDDSTKMKDLPQTSKISTGRRNLQFNSLPFHHKEYRDYLLDLTVGEYRKLLGKIPLNSTAEVVREMSDRILELDKKDNYTLRALDVYSKLVGASEVEVGSDKYWVGVHRAISSKAKNTHLVKILEHLVESSCESGISARLRDEAVEVLFTRNRTWVQPVKYSDYVASKLLDVTDDPEVVWKVLRGVSNSGKPLSYEKWVKYLEDWEEYKEIPSEIVVEFL